jgi:hypothetical protein
VENIASPRNSVALFLYAWDIVYFHVFKYFNTSTLLQHCQVFCSACMLTLEL